MIEWVTDNVRPLVDGNLLLLTQEQDKINGCVPVGKTRGAIDTILKGERFIPRDQHLVVANCDQLLQFPENLEMRGDGIVFTFRSNNSAHSYVETVNDPLLDGLEDYIVSIVEKPENPPSDRAVSGVYWFHAAGDFLDACREVSKGIEGEQYISAALSQMLSWGYDLYAVDAPTAILGTPEDFQRFETALAIARAA